MKKIFHLAMITIIIGALFISCDQNTGGDDASDDGSTSDSILYKAGTYTATAKGFGDGLKLEVTFDSKKITMVKILAHNESATHPTYGENVTKAIVDIPVAIVAAQSTSVDKVAGATKTTEGIKAAVNDAIAQAAL